MQLYANILILLSVFVVIKGNTPALLTIDRNWEVQDDDPVGLVVQRVSTHDQDGDVLHYTLSSPSLGQDGSEFFSVDSSGRIMVKKSLIGQGGKDFYIKVSVSDGTIPSSAEVRVQVLSAGQRSKHLHHNGGLLAALNPGISSRVPYTNNPIGPGINFFRDRGPPKGTPPVLHLPDSGLWQVPHTKKVNSTLDHIIGFDVADDSAIITFAIRDNKNLLAIEPKTGEVKIAKSLLYEVGDHRVTVYASNNHGTGTGDMILRVTGPREYRFTPPSIAPSTTETPPPLDASDSSSLGDIVEEHTEPGLIAIIKNGPTAPPSSVESTDSSEESLSNSDADDAENPKETEIKFVVIVLPILGLSLAAAIVVWCCCKSNKERKLSKENSSVKYDKKGLELTPASSASNTLVHGITPGFPSSIRRFWPRRASENSYEENQNAPKLPNRSLSTSRNLIIEPPDEWEFPRHKLKVIGILGEGCFGQVWKYEAQDIRGYPPGKALVAVKTLKESAGQQERNDLEQELKVLKSLGSHPNVVSLIACCTEKEPILVVLEYLVNGKLQTYLRERRSQTHYNNLHGTSTSLSPRDLTIFALQVAKGMDYLSSHGIVHRDLAARNILVGEDKICKVADFGFARDVANNHVYERKSDGRLPIRWMAVESLYDNIFSSKSDVWSFGILLWEIVTLGSTPYPGMAAEEVMKRIRDGYRLEKPNYCKREVYNIMYYCWYEDPKERPTFKELIKHLEDLITSEVDYIEINKFPERCYYNINTNAATGELL